MLGLGFGPGDRVTGATVVLGAAWVITELRATTPLIDMKIMRRIAVWTNNLVVLLIGVGMYATFAFLPEFVQTPSAAGYGFGTVRHDVTTGDVMALVWAMPGGGPRLRRSPS